MHERTRRLHSRHVLALMVVAMALSLAAPLATSGATFTVKLSKVVGGLKAPTQVTNAGDGTNRLFVVEQRGTIRVVKDGALQSGYFMDIRSKVASGGERGLLGLAFHPDFASNGYLYVYYTRNGGDVVVSRFKTNAAGTNVDETTASPLLLIEHSAQSNHNGGAIAFGPSGNLFIGVGDGGGRGDPGNDAQEKTTTLLGKILRINVNGTGSGTYGRYSIPSSNPFAGAVKGRGEIWAYGLRNPWRISFDRGTGKLFIADVGQDRYEEIDREPAGHAGGRNYGWNAMEGKHCYKSSKCPLAGDTLPVAEYAHTGGRCSITGGYVYRGSAYPVMVGQYFYADYCTGKIYTIRHDGTAKTLRRDSKQNPTSFGESESGELYLVGSSGVLYRVKPA